MDILNVLGGYQNIWDARIQRATGDYMPGRRKILGGNSDYLYTSHIDTGFKQLLPLNNVQSPLKIILKPIVSQDEEKSVIDDIYSKTVIEFADDNTFNEFIGKPIMITSVPNDKHAESRGYVGYLIAMDSDGGVLFYPNNQLEYTEITTAYFTKKGIKDIQKVSDIVEYHDSCVAKKIDPNSFTGMYPKNIKANLCTETYYDALKTMHNFNNLVI